MIELILEAQNIERAIAHLLEKSDSSGVDGMRLSALPDYIQNNMPASIAVTHAHRQKLCRITYKTICPHFVHLY